LEGEFPPPIKRFRDAIETMLQELKVYAGDRIQYQFIDPAENIELLQAFAGRGIQPVPINVRNSELEQSQKYMLPVAVLTYNGQDEYIDLLKGATMPTGEVSTLKAEAELEYKIIAAIRRLLRGKKKIVAILQGHGEPTLDQLKELVTELKQFYLVNTVTVKNGDPIPATKAAMPDSLKVQIKGEGVDVLLVLQPDSAFTEREKYEIDQFIMRGGKVLWCFDQQRVNLQNGPATLSQPRQLNLDDLCMNYGFKVNTDLIQDRSCGFLDVVQGFHNGPVWRSMPWCYYPKVQFFPDHPVTKNLDVVLMRYASSIDTLPRSGITAEVLMVSSPLSRAQKGVIAIDLNELMTSPPPPEVLRGKGLRPLGVLLSGTFNSNFIGRELQTDSFAPQPATARFLPRTPYPNRMIVLSDGALVLGNDARGRKDPFMPFDNKQLILNCIDYLAGDLSMTEIRSKDIQFRSLDREKVRPNILNIQILNIAVPVLMVIVFGIIRYYQRRARYGKKKN
jgi:gliding-associated putative ABC transporter substrate-binding component GldG